MKANRMWLFSDVIEKNIYSLLKEEKEQSEADRICSTINYWISIKNQGRIEEISLLRKTNLCF